jgi:NAD(P)H-flavin reductase
MYFHNVILSVMLLIQCSQGFRSAHRLSPVRQGCIRMMCTSMGWESSSIISNKREAEGMRVIEIQASDLIAESYISAGQYVQIKKDGGKPGFYAMASPPDKRNIFTFLVKESEANAFLLDTKDGEKTEVSLAQGKGFQTTEYLEKYKFDYPVSNVLLMACGSGLAPIAAAIESGTLGLKLTNYNSLFERRAILYLGARTLEHLPFAAKFAAWEELGVTVIPVLSKPSDNYDGRSGYIQDALAKDTIKVPKNTAALLCGQR